MHFLIMVDLNRQWMKTFLFLILLFCYFNSFLNLYARPYIIGHRGSCGMLPEHTKEGYELAIQQGADFIECDIVMTKDGVPICRHEPNLIDSTDVEKRREFVKRRKSYVIDGQLVTGIFSVDLTLAEIKSIRTTQRLPFRDQSFNGMFSIPTLEEYLDLARKKNVGVYPETKHSEWHKSVGLKIEDKLLHFLNKYGFENSTSKAYIQSFEPRSLLYVKPKTSIPLVLLLDEDWNQLYNRFPVFEDGKNHSDSKILSKISNFATAIGPNKNLIIPKNKKNNKLLAPTKLITKAKKYNLKIHPYVFRNENEFLVFDYGQDPYEEYFVFINRMKIDALFTDFPATAKNFIRCKLEAKVCTN